MMLTCLALALAPVARLGDPSVLAVSPAKTARARALVRQLGSPIYRERDAASRELARLGPAAAGPLAEAADDPDAEIRARVGQLGPAAAEEETRRRAELFLLDWAGRYEHNLPGWALLASITGDSAPAKRLYAEVYRRPGNRAILLAIEGAAPLPAAGLGLVGGLGAARPHRPPAGPRSALAAALAARRLELGLGQVASRRGGDATTPGGQADAAAVLFGEILSPAPESVWAERREYRPELYLARDGSGRTLRGQGPFGAALPGLVRRWAGAQAAPSGLVAAMNAVAEAGFDSGAIRAAAARVVAAGEAPPGSRTQAAIMLARHGTLADLPVLLGVASDPTPAGFVNGDDGAVVPIEVGHVALAHAVLLANRRPQEFGFAGSGVRAGTQGYYFAAKPGQTQASQASEARRRFAEFLVESHATLGGVAGFAATGLAGGTP